METIHGFKYCGYWVEYQSPENRDGAVWVYESTSEFDDPEPVKSFPSSEQAIAWIEIGLDTEIPLWDDA